MIYKYAYICIYPYVLTDFIKFQNLLDFYEFEVTQKHVDADTCFDELNLNKF